MASLNVDIVTPEKVVFSGPADEVFAPGVNGEFGVLAQHALFLTLLQPGVVTVKSGGQASRYAVSSGFAEAGPDRLVVLTEACLAASAIDKGAAEAELAEAEAVIGRTTPGEEARMLAEAKAAFALAKLSV